MLLNNFPGFFEIYNTVIYSVLNLKKAPRPNLCFCIRPKTTPLWPSDPKEVNGNENRRKKEKKEEEEEEKIWKCMFKYDNESACV